MKKTQIFLVLGISCGGLLSGLAMRRVTQAEPVAPPAAVEAKPAAAARPAQTAPPAAATAPLAPPKSADTVETLLALDDAALLPRLAAWLPGAPAQDIAAYWTGYRAAGNPKPWIIDLTFIHWTRLDPEGAIAAAVGTPDSLCPWWAWSANDPGAALAAAANATPKILEGVAGGIGRFHPDWLLEHLDLVPESVRPVALRLFKEQHGGENPLKSLEFMRENGLGSDAGTFKNLVRDDPWAALDWAEQNPSILERDGTLEILAETVAGEHPDDLERIAASLPSGLLKRTMEAAAFGQLAAENPQAAMAAAKATESDFIAAQRYATIGASLARTDPDQAFGILEMFWGDAQGGPALASKDYPLSQVATPDGVAERMSGSIEIDKLTRALVESDPERLVRTALAAGKPVDSVTSMWAGYDVASYAAWADRQTDPAIREPAVATLIGRLKGMGQYAEAIEWMGTTGKAGNSNLNSLMRDWGRSDPGGAAAWVRTSNLSADQKARYQEVIATERNQ